MPLKIEEMYAFVVKEKETNDEGVMGFLAPNNQWIPLVGADMNRVTSLIPLANIVAMEAGIEYRILKFTTRTDITDEVKK